MPVKASARQSNKRSSARSIGSPNASNRRNEQRAVAFCRSSSAENVPNTPRRWHHVCYDECMNKSLLSTTFAGLALLAVGCDDTRDATVERAQDAEREAR